MRRRQDKVDRGPRGSAGRVSASKRPMRPVEPERPRPLQTGLSESANGGEPAYPPWPHSACPPEGLAGGCAPSDPRDGNGAP